MLGKCDPYHIRQLFNVDAFDVSVGVAMKITKAKLQQIIRETVGELTEENMITLEFTQKEANNLLLALEQVEQSPEIQSLYGKILDAGLGGGFRE